MANDCADVGQHPGKLARFGRFCRRQARIIVIAAALVLAPLASFVYDRFASRSILVEADTGTVHVTLTSELRGKAFRNATVCRARDVLDIRASGAPLGCNTKTHQLTPSANGEAPGVETFDTALPSGTSLLLFSEPGRVSIKIEEVPPRYAESDLAKLTGGGITLSGAAVEEFGSLVLSGRAVIGAGPSETDRVPVVAGSYQITGRTATGVWSQRRILRDGELRSGAHLYFRARDEARLQFRTRHEKREPGAEEAGNKEPEIAIAPLGVPAAEARLHLTIPDLQKPFFRVTAISEYEPVDLTLLYYRAEPVVVRPSIVDTMANDPVLLLFATLVAGGITIIQFFKPRKKPDEQHRTIS